MNWKIFAVAVLLLLSGCSDDGFSTMEDGSRYKLHRFGDSPADSAADEVVYLSARVYQAEHQLLDSHFLAVEALDTSWYRVLRKFKVGDSLTYLSEDNHLHLPTGSTAPFRYELLMLNPQEYQKRFTAWKREYAFGQIARSDSVVENYTLVDGVLVKILAAGDSTKPIVPGAEVALHYTGEVLHQPGQKIVFDDTRRMNRPFEFTYGKEGQVIEGIERVLPRLHAGNVVRLIIPPALAFGSREAAGGMVPPYSIVIYSVEVVSVL